MQVFQSVECHHKLTGLRVTKRKRLGRLDSEDRAESAQQNPFPFLTDQSQIFSRNTRSRRQTFKHKHATLSFQSLTSLSTQSISTGVLREATSSDPPFTQELDGPPCPYPRKAHSHSSQMASGLRIRDAGCARQRRSREHRTSCAKEAYGGG